LPFFATLFITETHIAEEVVEVLWIKEETQPEPTKNNELDHTRTLMAKGINHWMTLSVPTEEMWQAATQNDHDLKLVLKALQNGIELARVTLLVKKQYHKEWNEGRVEHKIGIVYQLEVSKATKFRQFQWRIVPTTLRATILVKYHAMPMVGHSRVYKRCWRIAALMVAQNEHGH
jgi:hypothetical protein